MVDTAAYMIILYCTTSKRLKALAQGPGFPTSLARLGRDEGIEVLYFH